MFPVWCVRVDRDGGIFFVLPCVDSLVWIPTSLLFVVYTEFFYMSLWRNRVLLGSFIVESSIRTWCSSVSLCFWCGCCWC